MKNENKTILSLFDYSGRWSRPYKELGYEVYQVDIKLGIDILELDVKDMPFDSLHGILAAPPCTDFASSGAQYWKVKDADGRTDASLALVDKVLEFVDYYNPKFWVLENPVGRLPKLRGQLGSPWYFNPNEFAGWLEGEESEAERYTKKTGLWGRFNKPERRSLEVTGASWIMKLGGKSERTKELRSMTPLGFAYAFCAANP
jgi:site-specific DNA-cytosine methylase